MLRRAFSIALVLVAAAGSTRAASRPFSFFGAEFLPPERALAAAQAFVTERLTPGLPLAEARARLRAAEMPCRRPEADGGFACSLGVPVHIGGGLIGEDTWSVRVQADAAGRVAAASLDHRVIGTGPPNPQ